MDLQNSDHLEHNKLKEQSPMLCGKKVLVVDDDVRNVYVLMNTLEKQGMRVITAHDGRECLEELEKNLDANLILLDIMIPALDGYEAMKLIRNQERFAKLPIIALTAKAMRQDRERCLEAGASDYISKPINMEQLYSIMRVWLSK